jgi:hypothetical protein
MSHQTTRENNRRLPWNRANKIEVDRDIIIRFPNQKLGFFSPYWT